jgi:hypothetical protein
MTRPAARTFVGIRLGGALAEVDALAEELATTRSAVLRGLLHLGLAAYRSGRRWP